LLDSQVAEAARRFEHIQRVLSQAVTGASFSVGLVQLETEESLEEVLARADRAMYADKRAEPGAAAAQPATP
jgi:PleD family two-component response regulator